MHSKDYWNLQVRVSGKYVKLYKFHSLLICNGV